MIGAPHFVKRLRLDRRLKAHGTRKNIITLNPLPLVLDFKSQISNLKFEI